VRHTSWMLVLHPQRPKDLLPHEYGIH
jgi:hypothetical protein